MVYRLFNLKYGKVRKAKNIRNSSHILQEVMKNNELQRNKCNALFIQSTTKQQKALHLHEYTFLNLLLQMYKNKIYGYPIEIYLHL